MIVVDASVAFEVVLRTPLGKRANARLAGEDVHVPHLVDIEIASVVRRHLLTADLDMEAAEEALLNLLEWPLTRHAHTMLLSRIWELRNSVTAYDASYVALAETLDVPLLTCDARLARAHGHLAKIELLG